MALRLTLREVEVFCAIAQCGSVQKASDVIGLTQSAASQALARFEQTLQQRLFDRVGRRLVLNAYGRTLFVQARLLLDKANTLEHMFTSSALSLRIGASTTIGNYLMPAQLAVFHKIYPDADLYLKVGNTEQVIEAVANFDVDIGFIEGPCRHPGLRVFPWRDDELVVFVKGSALQAAQKNLSAKQLADMPWLMREAGSGTREEVERMLLPYLGSFNLNMEMGDSEAIKHAVAAGLGVSCLSRYVIADMLAQKQVVEVRAGLPSLKREFYGVMHKERELSAGISDFLACSPA